MEDFNIGNKNSLKSRREKRKWFKVSPKLDPKNPLHKKLSGISQKCHRLKSEGKEKEIEKLEKENDELVRKLFKIK